MCFWILTGNGTIVSRSSVQALSKDELCIDSIQNQIQTFDQAINAKIGNHINSLDLPVPNKQPLYILDMDGKDNVNEA